MLAQLTELEIIETVAQIKEFKPSDIFNLKMSHDGGTFDHSKSRYMFDLTPKKTGVNVKSVKFLAYISNYDNCSY